MLSRLLVQRQQTANFTAKHHVRSAINCSRLLPAINHSLTAPYPPLLSCKSFSRVLRFTSGLIEIYNHLSYPPKRKRRCCEALLRYLICYYHYYIILINNFAFSGISIKMLHIGSPSGDCRCCSTIFMTQPIAAKFSII